MVCTDLRFIFFMYFDSVAELHKAFWKMKCLQAIYFPNCLHSAFSCDTRKVPSGYPLDITGIF